MEKAKEYDIAPSRLHIDPLVEMLCTSEDGISSILEVIREIEHQYPTIHVTGGARNISFNLPTRKFVNQAFLILAMGVGMDREVVPLLGPPLFHFKFTSNSSGASVSLSPRGEGY